MSLGCRGEAAGWDSILRVRLRRVGCSGFSGERWFGGLRAVGVRRQGGILRR